MGCLGVGEAARGEQLIANQGQEWMGIRTTSKRSCLSKYVKRGVSKYEEGWGNGKREAKGGVYCKAASMYIVIACYLQITLFCV